MEESQLQAMQKQEPSELLSNTNVLKEIAEENVKLDEMLKEEKYKDYRWTILTQPDLNKIPINIDGQIIDIQTSRKQSLIQANIRLKEILLSNYLYATNYMNIFQTKYQSNDSNSTEYSSEDSTISGQHKWTDTACYHLLSEIYRLREENKLLNQRLSALQILPETLQDDKKVKFYTGLPSFAVMMTVFHYVIRDTKLPGKYTLNSFQKFMLTMLKLRLNLTTEDLAYRFGSTMSRVAPTLTASLEIFYIRLKPLIIWPSRQQRSLTMPTEFKRYFGPNITVIIDCFEILIEKPSNLLARSKTWSSYKMRNTVKYLIGITPQGTVSFISQGWGGRVSDKYITENCGILDKLSAGDIILADKGFNITESVSTKGAIALTSGSTKNRSQLSAFEIERTRKIAHVRIHVERIIGLMRLKYKILQSTLPLAYFQTQKEVPVVDKIVTICCALINLCPSIVPNN